ncbi:MAG TPA: DUF1659 domain-containing protein [Firmicutes bacterium]|jgi:hypothetical protein|nr:DUF1659 domain-containing protein [Bacillota bacterium]
MAVERTPEVSRLQLQLQTGIDEDNKPIVKNRSFSNVKADAADEDVHAVAQSLAGLQQHPLLTVRRIDTSALDEVI